MCNNCRRQKIKIVLREEDHKDIIDAIIKMAEKNNQKQKQKETTL
jgi:nitrogen regulatory protein PII